MSSRLVTGHRAIAGAITLLALLTGAARAQNAPQPFKNWEAASVPDSLRAEPRLQCEAVVSMTGCEFSILSSTRVPGSGSLPQFCRILGQILDEASATNLNTNRERENLEA